MILVIGGGKMGLSHLAIASALIGKGNVRCATPVGCNGGRLPGWGIAVFTILRRPGKALARSQVP